MLYAQQTPEPVALTDSERLLLRHGLVPEPMRAVIRSQTVAQVIAPCARALVVSDAKSASDLTSTESR